MDTGLMEGRPSMEISGKWPKLVQDPIHKLISFEDHEGDHLLLKLIDSKEFQRLRRIKQLGLSELVFPTATHNRFSHSLGVLHLTKKILERIERLGEKIEDQQKVIILCSALLHDIGHGPFSHAFEAITKEDHEKRTLDIIRDGETEINKILRDFDPGLPNQIAYFFLLDEEDNNAASSSINDLPSFYSDIISSQLDADRFDYLLRDSYMTGTYYGNFDLEWIIQRLYIDKGKNRFYLSRKAFSAAETYIFSRYHMYRSVYFHKATRAAEVMLKSLFSRYKELIQTPKMKKEDVAPDSSPVVFKSFSETMELQDYLMLDDVTILEFLKSCAKSKDTILRNLADGLLNRNLYKCIDISETDPNKSNQVYHAQFYHAVMEMMKEKHIDTTYNFIVDSPADIPYKPYDPDEDRPPTQIYIEDQEISKISKSVKELTNYTFYRYYFPGYLRDEIEQIAHDTGIPRRKP